MKVSLLALSAFLTGASANMADIRAKRRLNKQFMEAMHADKKIAAAQKKHRVQKIRQLQEDLFKASRKLTNQQYMNYNQYEQQAYQDQQEYNQQKAEYEQQEAQQQYEQYQQQQQFQDYYNYQQQNDEKYEQGEAYADVAEWNGQYWEFDDELPFDMTSRAFKYSGCAAIKTYDEYRAQENGNGNPMVMDTYAVFRLCPANKCNKYSMNGCGKNYGEYAIEMKTYLSYVLNYYDSRFEDFCDYCEPCDAEYQAYAKTSLQQCYQQLTQQEYALAQQAKQQAYQQYYNANNGDMSGWKVYSGAIDGDGFESYNAENNAEHSGNNMYYNNARNNHGTNYGANNDNTDNGMYNQGNQYANGYYNSNNDDRRKMEEAQNAGYVDENGEWVDGEQQNAQANGYYDQYNNWVEGEQPQNQNYGSNGGYGGLYYDQNGEAMSGYWGGDGKWYQFDNEQAEYQLMQCQDGSLCDQCEYQNEQQYRWCDDYICGSYYTYCSDLYGEVKREFDVMEYLECGQFETEEGDIFFIGPHCGSDHYTINLGVFSDENCLNYIGDQVSLKSILGYNYDDEDVFKLPKECISCDGAPVDDEDQEDYSQQQPEGRYGDYYTAPETDQDGVLAVCRALYHGSAQCDMNMKTFSTVSQYMSQYELDLEQRTCAFIDNILFGSYDEQGEILLHAESFDFNDWRNPQQLRKLRMPASQAIFLSLSIILCVAMAAAAIFTHRAIKRASSPWRPRRPEGARSAEELKRQSSGVAIARARSGPNTSLLI